MDEQYILLGGCQGCGSIRWNTAHCRLGLEIGSCLVSQVDKHDKDDHNDEDGELFHAPRRISPNLMTLSTKTPGNSIYQV